MKMTISNEVDHYCNQKFWWLSVDLEKSRSQSCCAASPHKIDLEWLANNPASVFNDPVFLQERRDMLANVPVQSCESSCWQPERQNMVSRRRSMQGELRTHTDLDCAPSTINIVMGSQCNMACVYCCKNYSSTWRNDILRDGDYAVRAHDDRYQKNRTDQVLQRLGMNDIAQSESRSLVQQAILHPDQISRLETVIIGGGEPLLYNDLDRMISGLPQHCDVQIITGLGVNPHRMAKVLDGFTDRSITLIVSAEGTHKYYEFARHGNTWTRFQENLDLIRDSGISFQFNATLSNITLFGLQDFVDFADRAHINYQHCTDPEFLSISVMDVDSKQQLRQQLDILPEPPRSMVIQMLDIEPSHQQITNFRSFIREFAARRQLDTSIFPRTFQAWIDQ